MADFNNLKLTFRGIKALLEAQAGNKLTLSKIGMGSGSTTDNILGLTNLVSMKALLPITEKIVDDESKYLTIGARMTNESVTEGFYWRETGLFFEDSDGNDVLFAYSCLTSEDKYDYVPAYSDQRYLKYVRIASVISDSENIVLQENEGLLYVDTMTFEDYKASIELRLSEIVNQPTGNNPNMIVNSNLANPVNQRGVTAATWRYGYYGLDRWFLPDTGTKIESIDENGLTIKKGGYYPAELHQRIAVKDIEFGKTYTLSACINGVVGSVSLLMQERKSAEKEIFDDVYLKILGSYINNGYVVVEVVNYTTSPITVKWMKFEQSEGATPYIIPLYNDELMRCGVPDDESIFGYKEYYNKVAPNNNLLINSNFAKPVNQRGFNNGSVTVIGKYLNTIDRWCIARLNGEAHTKLTVNSGYITLSGTKSDGNGMVNLFQKLEYLPNGFYTMSAKINGKVYSATFDYKGETIDKTVGNGIYFTMAAVKNVFISVDIDVVASANIEWAKLEPGRYVTPYVFPLYSDELIRCGVPDDSSELGYKKVERHLLVSALPTNPDPNTFYYIPEE